jgi:hypothetical protein
MGMVNPRAGERGWVRWSRGSHCGGLQAERSSSLTTPPASPFNNLVHHLKLLSVFSIKSSTSILPSSPVTPGPRSPPSVISARAADMPARPGTKPARAPPKADNTQPCPIRPKHPPTRQHGKPAPRPPSVSGESIGETAWGQPGRSAGPAAFWASTTTSRQHPPST